MCSPYYEWLLQADFGKLTGDLSDLDIRVSQVLFSI